MYQVNSITSPVFNCEMCNNHFSLIECEAEHTICRNCGESGENIWGEVCICAEHIHNNLIDQFKQLAPDDWKLKLAMFAL